MVHFTLLIFLLGVDVGKVNISQTIHPTKNPADFVQNSYHCNMNIVTFDLGGYGGC